MKSFIMSGLASLTSGIATQLQLGAVRRSDGYRDKAYDTVRAARAKQREAEQRNAKRALLDRQSRREMNGFYDGTPSVASALAAQGSGRKYRRVRKDVGKRSSPNLVRVW